MVKQRPERPRWCGWFAAWNHVKPIESSQVSCQNPAGQENMAGKDWQPIESHQETAGLTGLTCPLKPTESPGGQNAFSIIFPLNNASQTALSGLLLLLLLLWLWWLLVVVLLLVLVIVIVVVLYKTLLQAPFAPAGVGGQYTRYYTLLHTITHYYTHTYIYIHIYIYTYIYIYT